MNGDLAAQISYENGYDEAFLEIVSTGNVDGPEGFLKVVEGIAAQLKKPGEREISDRQREVIHKVVDNFIKHNDCVCNCAEVDDVPSLIESGLCYKHAHEMSKDD